MASISFKNDNITVEAEPGTKLADCIRKAGLHIETPCNCIGSCGKCRVKAVGELYPPTEEEARFIKGSIGIRLACMARVKGDVEIELPSSGKALKTIDRGFAIAVQLDSDTKKVTLPDIDRGSSKPYIESLPCKLGDYSILEKLGAAEKDKTGKFVGVTWCGKLMDIAGELPYILGVAVDIGTTGISTYLVDLESGEVLSSVSSLNPQTQFGGDVLTRISYCMNNIDGAKLLRESIITKIDSMIGELVNGRYSRSSVYRITVAGNTTMLHLFLGVDTGSVAKAPYRPVFLDRVDLRAGDISININKNGMLTLLPSASGYVGADILAGITATAFESKTEPAIFVDIGTNGEIAAVNNGRLAATSTAAGPALEGMNIACGCRAEAGAIDSFSMDEDYNISFTTIGGSEARGICGSGLIDITAAFVMKGIVLKSGRFNSDIDHRLKDRLRDKRFYITDEIYLSQKDIRQIQLAKGAIAAGIAMLLSEIGLPVEQVSEAVIAGAFGYHLNPRSIMDIGLIPKGFNGKITFVGNSSLEGARIALLNKSMLGRMEELKDEMTVLELSTKEKFQEYFVNELNF